MIEQHIQKLIDVLRVMLERSPIVPIPILV